MILQLNGVIIDNNDKFSHYLRELYCSGTFNEKTVIEWENKPTEDQTYADAIMLFENKRDGMDKVGRLTGNTNLVKNGFSRANDAIYWVNKVKDVITKAVAATIQQKDNEHVLALTEMRTANEQELKKYHKRSPPSAR